VVYRLRTTALWGGLILYSCLLFFGLYFNFQAPRLNLPAEWDGETWIVTQAVGPLVAGDKVEAVGGVQGRDALLVDNVYISERGEFFRWLDTKDRIFQQLSGGSVPITVVREGRESTVDLDVVRRDWKFLRGPIAVHVLVGLVFFLVGWATLRAPGSGPQAFWFYLLCLSMSLVYQSNATSLMASPVLEPLFFRTVNIINTVNFLMAPALLLHFALLLPRDRFKSWMAALIYLPALYALCTWNISLINLLVPTYFLGSLLAIGQGAWAYGGLVERQQMKWVGVGFLFGVGPWVLLNGLPLLFVGERLMTDTLPGACLVFIPIFMAVAVRRYRLFDVGDFLQGTALYLVTLGILVMVDFTLLSWLGFGDRFGEAELTSFVVLLALYAPLRRKLGSLASNLTGRARADEAEALALLDEQLQMAGPTEVATALEVTVHYLFSPRRMERVETPEKEPGVYQVLEEDAHLLLVLESDLAILCGPGPGAPFYTSQDLELLEALVRHASLYLQTVRLHREAAEERERRLGEREQLLGDLHDGVGSALSNIRLISKEARVSRLAADALFELQNFLYSGPEYTLPRIQFVEDVRRYGESLFDSEPLSFQLSIVGELEGTLTRAFALSVFRLLKEALSNALKHSEGERLEVTLEFQDDPRQLVITVENECAGRGDGSKGLGLRSIRIRAGELGGEAEISEAPKFCVRVTLPL